MGQFIGLKVVSCIMMKFQTRPVIFGKGVKQMGKKAVFAKSNKVRHCPDHTGFISGYVYKNL